MQRLRAIGLALSVAILAGSLHAGQPRQRQKRERAPRVVLFGESFQIQQTAGLVALQEFVRSLLADSEQARQNFEQNRHSLLADRSLLELGQDELVVYFHFPDGTITKKDRRGLRAIEERISGLTVNNDPNEIGRRHAEIRELSAAVMNSHRSPIPSVGLSSTFMVFDSLRNSVGNGDTLAKNLSKCGKAFCDCSPGDSTFWKKQDTIGDHDLGAGFGRKSVPNWASMIWEYDAPKTSRGANPGFKIRNGKSRAKIKFAETFSEPFTARVFHALGYNVDVTDHVAALRLRYDRRVFREFNLRHALALRVRPFGLFTAYSFNMQVWHDPFNYIEEVVLKSGKRLNRQEFRKRLLNDFAVEKPEQIPSNFNGHFERQIDHLVTVPVNFQIDNHDVKSVGPWGFDQLGHEHLREVRGAALLAAWLGWFDTRFDNTRLRLDDGRLRHYFSDLGGGLGRSDVGFNWKSESPNDFPWEFTEAPIVRGKGRMTTPFKVIHFNTILDNEAFQEMTSADAVWMAKLIAQLSRKQIVDGLIASGYDAAETMLYAEKLVRRRNKMIHDLGLENRYPDLPQNFDTREFNYIPETGPQQIVEGILVRRNIEPPNWDYDRMVKD